MVRDQKCRTGHRHAVAAAGVAALTVGLALIAALTAGTVGVLHAAPAARSTRADLAAERRRMARLEGEYALASTRRAYIVLDLAAGVLRYRLMGMTMREIPTGPVDVAGLVAAGGGAGSATQLAGIFTMIEKEGDPRLNPLTPEQVEAGADDENVAAVFPPEPPKSYRVSFRQPVSIDVSGAESRAGVRGVGAWFRDLAGGLFGRREDDAAVLRVALRLDPETASEFWRSIVPDQRWLIVPPDGLALPQAGQEPPPKPKAPRAAVVAKKPKKPEPEEGVPFQIPPPVEPPGANGGEEPPGTNGADEPPGPPPGTDGGR